MPSRLVFLLLLHFLLISSTTAFFYTPPLLSRVPIGEIVPRLSNRVFPDPSVPYLVVNVSWSVSTLSPNSTEADLDTSIGIQTSSSPNSLTGTKFFGTFCRHTFSTPAVQFSGDDVYATGWEAYTINLPLVYDISVDPEPYFFVNAQWHNEARSSASVAVDATLFSAESVVLQNYSSPITVLNVFNSFGSATGCSRFPKVAFRLSPKASLLSPSFSLEELPAFSFPSYEPGETPEPSFAPTAEPEPEPSFDPATGVIARVIFSWTSASTDVESAIQFAGSKVGANCGLSSTRYVSYSGNDYGRVGSESFRILVQTARESGAWQNSTVIPLFADWWSSRPSSSSRARVSVVLQAEDGFILFSRTLRIYPDVGMRCSSHQAARLTLEYDDSSDSYSASLRALPPPLVVPSEEPTMSPEPTTPSDPFSKRTRKGIKLQLTFMWNRTFTDLRTALQFPDYDDSDFEFIGGRCHEFNRYVYRSRNMKMKTMKQYFVSVEAAREEGVWNSSVQIPLIADWRKYYPNGGGVASVTAVLMDEDGESLFPPSAVTVIPGCLGGTCPIRVVGTARVMYNAESDQYSLELMSDALAAPPSFFVPSPVRPRDEKVVAILVIQYPHSAASISHDSLISVEFNDVRVGGNCNSGLSPYILYSNVTFSGLGGVAITIRVEKALLDGVWNGNTDIKLFGPRVALGTINNGIYSTVISASGNSSSDSVSFSTSSTTATEDCSVTPQAVLNVVHNGRRNFMASFDESEPSPSPDYSEQPAPSTPPEEGMLIEYSWPESETDLDSAVALFDNREGTGCYSQGQIVTFYGDDTSSGGRERFWVSLPKALDLGLWSSFVDLTLIAKWYGREKYSGGTATVTVSYIGEDLEVQKSVSKEFNPVKRQTGILGTDCSNKIGRVRVVRSTDGNVSFSLEHY